MCVGSSVSYVLLISFPFPLLEDILVHMWINYVSHAPLAIKKQYQHFSAATETPLYLIGQHHFLEQMGEKERRNKLTKNVS